MNVIGLIREGKYPLDNRVALTPAQCRWISDNIPACKIIVQPSPNRCFSDDEYRRAGISVEDNMESCSILLGIKEVPVNMLIDNKTYIFFSHTRKNSHITVRYCML